MNLTEAWLEQLPASLRNRIQRSSAEIARLGLVLRGTVAAYHTTCGKPSCRCTEEPTARHGPYFQWTTKIEGKTRTVRLKRSDVPLYRRAIENGRRLDELIAAWTSASMEALDLIRTKSHS